MKHLIEHLEFIIQVDHEDTVLRDAAIVINDDLIEDIGPSAEVLERHDRDAFDSVINGEFRGVCPGFIDAHVHMSETLSRAVFPDDLDTRTWVFHWAKPFYANVGPDDERISVLLGCAEMLRNGTTCFLDMGAQHDPAITVTAPRNHRPPRRRQRAREVAGGLDRSDGGTSLLPRRRGRSRSAG